MDNQEKSLIKLGGNIERVERQISFANNLLQKTEIKLIPYRKGDKWGFCNKSKRIVVQCQYDEVAQFTKGISIVKKKGKIGVVDEKGREIISCIYDKLERFNSDYFLVKKHDVYFLLDKTENQILSLKYDEVGVNAKNTIPDSFVNIPIRLDNCNLLSIKRNNKFGLINIQGKEIVPCICDCLPILFKDEGLIAIKKYAKFGFVDILGNEIIPFIYDGVRDYSGEGMIIVWMHHFVCEEDVDSPFFSFSINSDDKYEQISNNQSKNLMKYYRACYGFVDKSGEVISCQYDNATQFVDDLSVVRLDGKSGCINRIGKVVIPLMYDELEPFSEGLTVVAQEISRSYSAYYDDDGYIVNYKRGYINKYGQQIVPYIYDEAGTFVKGGIAFVSIDHKYGFINSLGQELTPLKYDNVEQRTDYGYLREDGFVGVSINDKWGVIDCYGNEVIPCEYDEIDRCGENEDVYAKLKQDGKFGFVDLKHKNFVKCIYDYIGYLNEELISVEKDKKWGFLDNVGQLVIEINYDDVGYFSNGYTPVQKEGKWGVIDKNENLLIQYKYGYIESFHDGLARVMNKQNDHKDVDPPILMGYINEEGVEYWED